jgi:hypothetical protein
VARFAAGLSRESVVDVAGVVSLPREPVRGTTQQVFDVLPLPPITTIPITSAVCSWQLFCRKWRSR